MSTKVLNGTASLPRLKLGIDVFTAGQCARMLGVAPRTLSKWCDHGLLPCYRVGGRGEQCAHGDRRILAGALREFARARGIPLPLPELPVQLLAVGLPDSVAAHLPGSRRVNSLLDLGLALDRHAARHVVVLDLAAVGRGESLAAARKLREEFAARLVALAGEDETRLAELEGAGFGWVLLSPIPEWALRVAVREALEGE